MKALHRVETNSDEMATRTSQTFCSSFCFIAVTVLHFFFVHIKYLHKWNKCGHLGAAEISYVHKTDIASRVTATFCSNWHFIRFGAPNSFWVHHHCTNPRYVTPCQAVIFKELHSVAFKFPWSDYVTWLTLYLTYSFQDQQWKESTIVSGVLKCAISEKIMKKRRLMIYPLSAHIFIFLWNNTSKSAMDKVSTARPPDYRAAQAVGSLDSSSASHYIK